MQTQNDLNPALITYIIDRKYPLYKQQYGDDLYSYGLQALHDADAKFDATRTTKPFKYVATCFITRTLSTYVRDRIHKIDKYITYTDDLTYYDSLKEDTTLQVDNKIMVEKLLKHLTPTERKLITAIYYYGFSIQKLAKRLKYPYHRLVIAHRKAIEKLKKEIEN